MKKTVLLPLFVVAFWLQIIPRPAHSTTSRYLELSGLENVNVVVQIQGSTSTAQYRDFLFAVRGAVLGVLSRKVNVSNTSPVSLIIRVQLGHDGTDPGDSLGVSGSACVELLLLERVRVIRNGKEVEAIVYRDGAMTPDSLPVVRDSARGLAEGFLRAVETARDAVGVEP